MLITCFLETNVQITTLSIFYEGDYEDLGALYKSMRNVEIFNTIHSNYLSRSHGLKLNLESMLDVILNNSNTLKMPMIPKSSPSNPINFANLVTKLCCKHEKSTRHLKYLHIYGEVTGAYSRIENPVTIFFEDNVEETSVMSPYNPCVKRLYRIGHDVNDRGLDIRERRLELDVTGLKKLLNSQKTILV